MKKAYIILILIISSLAVVGQELDRKFYLLGSLSDYMGRHYSKNNPSNWGYIMTLHQNEVGKIHRIEEVIGKKFNRRKEQKDCGNCQEFFDLKSFCLAKKINSFYGFHKNTGMKDNKGFTLFTGQLNCERVLKSTIGQQISFLAGQFLISGEKNGQIYKVSLYNSPSRFECLLKVLQSLQCEIISSEVNKAIPTGYFIEFKPTDEVHAVLEKEIYQ